MNIFCDECKKGIATVFLTKISGSEVSRVQLCGDCAKKMEETTEAANLLAFIPHILSGMHGMEEQLADDVLSGELITCESCGTSFTDFQKIGFLGCSRCYQAFGEAFQGLRASGKAPLLDHLADTIEFGGKNELLVDVEADIMLVGHNDPPIGTD